MAKHYHYTLYTLSNKVKSKVNKYEQGFCTQFWYRRNNGKITLSSVTLVNQYLFRNPIITQFSWPVWPGFSLRLENMKFLIKVLIYCRGRHLKQSIKNIGQYYLKYGKIFGGEHFIVNNWACCGSRYQEIDTECHKILWQAWEYCQSYFGTSCTSCTVRRAYITQ